MGAICAGGISKFGGFRREISELCYCLLYTSDAAEDSLRVDHGGRRISNK